MLKDCGLNGGVVKYKNGKLTISLPSDENKQLQAANISYGDNDNDTNDNDDDKKEDNGKNNNEKKNDNDKKKYNWKLPPKWLAQFGGKLLPQDYRYNMDLVRWEMKRNRLGKIIGFGKKLNIYIEDIVFSKYYGGENNPPVVFLGVIFECKGMTMINADLRCPCGKAQPKLTGCVDEIIRYDIEKCKVGKKDRWTHVGKNMYKVAKKKPWTCEWIRHMVNKNQICGGYDANFDSEPDVSEPDDSEPDDSDCLLDRYTYDEIYG